MKKISFAILSVLFIFAQTLSAQISSVSGTDYSKAQLTIKFFDKTMYYPENADENPVYVHISLKNTGTETLRFKLADDRMFSADFTAYTIKNSTLPLTESIVRKRSTNQTVYFREIALETGEEYSFVENVKDYIQFVSPSIYYIDLTFYPELYKAKNVAITSNRLTLEIQPSPSAASSTVVAIKDKTSSILHPQAISPDKVVEQTIIARQKSLWDQYFLYFDVEQMMLRNSVTKRRYNASNSEERSRLLSSYKADLMQNRIDFDIVAVPEKFEIINTSYSQIEGTVTVVEWFKYPTFRERKRYEYKVRQRDGIWRIYDYTVTNLGTE